MMNSIRLLQSNLDKFKSFSLPQNPLNSSYSNLEDFSLLVSFAKSSNNTPLSNRYSSISYGTFCLILFPQPKFIY